MSKNIILSICIPSYNRDVELKRLLDSIDASGNNAKDIEIVIREDRSPKRSDIAQIVAEYRKHSPYSVVYIENDENYGYDKNLRSVAACASGEWVIFMGDDDVFVPEALDKYLDFLRGSQNIGYMLRRYRKRYQDGSVEEARYAQNNVYFKAGQESIVELFRRSVFISGFTFRKKWFTDYECSDYDGTLLFQLYILACICNKHDSCYCDILITEALYGGVPYFGKSRAEKNLYDSGRNTVRNSVNFMKQVRILSKDIDRKLGTNIEDDIMISYSKYSYGFLHEHRDAGVQTFKKYAKVLRKMGFARTYHFYIYYFVLLILGKSNCQRLIMFVKKKTGSTPRL